MQEFNVEIEGTFSFHKVIKASSESEANAIALQELESLPIQYSLDLVTTEGKID